MLLVRSAAGPPDPCSDGRHQEGRASPVARWPAFTTCGPIKVLGLGRRALAGGRGVEGAKTGPPGRTPPAAARGAPSGVCPRPHQPACGGGGAPGGGQHLCGPCGHARPPGLRCLHPYTAAHRTSRRAAALPPESGQALAAGGSHARPPQLSAPLPREAPADWVTSICGQTGHAGRREFCGAGWAGGGCTGWQPSCCGCVGRAMRARGTWSGRALRAVGQLPRTAGLGGPGSGRRCSGGVV